MINIVDNMVALNHPFATRSNYITQFQYSNLVHSHSKPISSTKPPIMLAQPMHQPRNQPYECKHTHRPKKRNMTPTPLMKIQCSIPPSFQSNDSFSRSLFSRNQRQQFSPRFYHSPNHDGRHSFIRHFKPSSNPNPYRFNRNFSHFKQSSLIKSPGRLEDGYPCHANNTFSRGIKPNYAARH